MAEYNTVVVNLLSALKQNLDKSMYEKITFAGENTGNIIFTEAMKEQLNYSREIWLNPEELKEIEKPSVVLPSANFIIKGGDRLMETIICFLEKTDCPVTMAGLGAQAGENETPKELISRLSETKKRAFQMLSERAVSIGVRGEYSAECLKLMGINNVRVIGCPSFYFGRKEQVSALKRPSLDKTQVTITPGNSYKSLLRMGMKLNSYWMMQMSNELPQIIVTEDNWNRDWRLAIKNAYPHAGIISKQIWRYIQDRAVIYFEKESWNNFYKEKGITFAYGSRFHGNMAAFRNGVPTLWVTHDMRTCELTETLHLPRVAYKKFSEIRHAEQMLEMCDYAEYEKHVDKMYAEYVDFLKENKLNIMQENLRI